MKKNLLALIIALPLMLAGCSKDDNNGGSGSSSEFSFAQLNTWLEMSEGAVADQLLAAGYSENSQGTDMGIRAFMKVNYSTGEAVSCGLSTGDGGVIHSIQMTKMAGGITTAASTAFVKTYVGQMQELLKDEELTQGSGSIHVTEYEHPYYTSWTEFQAGMEGYANQENLSFEWSESHAVHYGSVISQCTEYNGRASSMQMIQLSK